MKRKIGAQFGCLLALGLALGGCSTRADPSTEAPPPAHVEHEQDLNVVKVDHPEQFSLATAGQRAARSQLVVTGAVSPDISRNVPVISLAAGRVTEIRARLGDTVQKGQLLMRVQSSDVSGAFSDYRKAVADEVLARTQLDRAKDLYDHGAIALNDLQVAQDAEDKAKVDVETSSDHLRLLGADLNHPSGSVDIVSPVSGVITDQQVTNAGGVQGLGTNLFTISDLSYVWVLCDVHENDLPFVRVGETADIRLNAYPGRVFKGTIDNIGAVLDPNIRTAKVRIEVSNPGLMRIGMFVTATFYGMTAEKHAVVPASAILHLHDRDWVFVPAGANQFRRTEVTAGEMLPDNMQEMDSGIGPGQQVVNDALALENTVEQ
jgi:cobalt-zinc-cadmium efflux system membrane fusion protein